MPENIKTLANENTDANALAEAVERQDEETVLRLLSAGCSPNGKTEEGVSLLELASFKGNLPIVKSLVNAGASVEYRTADGKCSPLTAAAMKGNLAIVEYLIERGAGVNGEDKPLIGASCWGCTPVVRYLIDAGADVNSMQDNVYPLSVATEYGHEEVVGILLAEGANPNGPTGCKATPLFPAIARQRPTIVLQLLAAGARVDAVDAWGNNLMDYAVLTRNKYIIAILSPGRQPPNDW